MQTSVELGDHALERDLSVRRFEELRDGIEDVNLVSLYRAKFGDATVDHIREMTAHRIERMFAATA